MPTEANIEKKTGDQVTRREHTRSGLHYQPNVDIVETGEALLVLVDMPGVGAGDVDVHFENGTLTIHGRTMPRQKDGTNFLLCEYGIGDFYRTFEVSETIASDRIAAEMENGVLALHLPKIEAARPRKIAVHAK